METTILQNERIKVTYEDECIRWYDLKDKYNDFQGFTRNKRGINKAVAFIQHLATVESLKDDLTMWNITSLLDEKFHLKPHTYCGMD